MRKIIPITCVIGVCLYNFSANAYLVNFPCSVENSNASTCFYLNGLPPECNQHSAESFNCQVPNLGIYDAECFIISCTACSSESYVLQQEELFTPNYDEVILDGFMGPYFIVPGCELYSCSNDPTCVSDTTYKSGNTGYEYKVNRSCSGNQCVESRVYRCASGYYGSSSNGTSGCNRCPTDSKTGVTGTSSAGTTSITECYQVKEKSFTDSTGTFEYVENCNYQN